MEQEQTPAGKSLTAAIADGLHSNWNKGDRITLFHDGQTVSVETLASGGTSGLSGSVEGTFTDSNPLYGVYPAESAVSSDRESMTVSVSAAQTAGSDGYDAKAAVSVARTVSESLTFHAIGGGIKLNFQMSGVTKVELESVDGYALAGTAMIKRDEQGMPVVAETKTLPPFWFSTPPIIPASPPEKTIISPPCLVTFMAGTGFPFIKTAWSRTISAYIRPWNGLII